MLKQNNFVSTMLDVITKNDHGVVELDIKWDHKEKVMHRLILTPDDRLVFGVEPSASPDYTIFSRLPESGFTKFFAIPKLIEKDDFVKLINEVWEEWEAYVCNIERYNTPDVNGEVMRNLLDGCEVIRDTVEVGKVRNTIRQNSKGLEITIESGVAYTTQNVFSRPMDDCKNLKSKTETMMTLLKELEVFTKEHQ